MFRISVYLTFLCCAQITCICDTNIFSLFTVFLQLDKIIYHGFVLKAKCNSNTRCHVCLSLEWVAIKQTQKKNKINKNRMGTNRNKVMDQGMKNTKGHYDHQRIPCYDDFSRMSWPIFEKSKKKKYNFTEIMIFLRVAFCRSKVS